MWSYRSKGKGCSQVAKFHQYAGACGFGDDERRQFLWEATGCKTSKDRRLGQQDFDLVMILLERRLRWLVEEGVTTVEELAGKRIGALDYWEGRNPSGCANTRQRKAMWDSWLELREFLPKADRTEPWLLLFCEQCCGSPDFWSATVVDAARILDGLRQRVKQERRATGREVVPLA